ncbi:type VII secretion target [Saccharothrix xinjiangensis]|uniref:Type VII secretion target n=1 Tax=Saccharothrix xinjiangensis TaxID=204798 RepID=A0ABV9YBP2_9PSEU
MSGFRVQAGQLRSFAGGQEGRQGEVAAVAADAAAIDLGGRTFGELLEFFANEAQQAAAEAAEKIGELATAYGEAAGDTIATATRYDDVEDGNRKRFGGGG